jgi:hypothetical protein
VSSCRALHLERELCFAKVRRRLDDRHRCRQSDRSRDRRRVSNGIGEVTRNRPLEPVMPITPSSRLSPIGVRRYRQRPSQTEFSDYSVVTRKIKSCKEISRGIPFRSGFADYSIVTRKCKQDNEISPGDSCLPVVPITSSSHVSPIAARGYGGPIIPSSHVSSIPARRYGQTLFFALRKYVRSKFSLRLVVAGVRTSTA